MPATSGGDSQTGSTGPDTVEVETVAAPSVGTTTSGPSANPSTTSGVPPSTGEPSGCLDEECLVDILVVVDNSRGMQNSQQELARTLVGLERALIQRGMDTHVMFTTTDYGNPACTPFQPEGYTPAAGAPVASACTERLPDFTGLGGGPVVEESCTEVCPSGVRPTGNYVHFSPTEDNVPRVAGVDIDGDGMNDSSAAQALACLAPMGISGCGYESPLESMLQALNPGAAWNQGPNAFMREGATLAVMMLSDEVDCSVDDYSMMTDPLYMETHPDIGEQIATSALCWNAGVSCTGPDAQGVYSDCQAAMPTTLQPVSRYTDHLVTNLRNVAGKPVVMVGISGVPLVTDHATLPPYTPVQGGVLDLEFHDWVDGEYPAGDLLPEDVGNGVTVEMQEYLFGIGPGCTAVEGPGGVGIQGLPPVRVRQVCEALNVSDALEDQRCCLESICDEDYRPALECLVGLIGHVAEPQ